jgi:hypothetical protein
MRDGDDAALDDYSSVLTGYFKPEDMAEYARYIVIDKPEQVSRLNTVPVNKLQDLTPDEIAAIMIAEDKMLTETEEPDQHQVNTIKDWSTDLGPFEPSHSYYGGGGISGPAVAPDRLKRMDLKVERSAKSLASFKLMYVATSDEIARAFELVEEATKYGIPIIIAKNRLGIEAIRDDPRVIPLSKASHKIIYSAQASGVGPKNTKELRAANLLRVISSIVGLPSDTFIIGNTTVHKVVMANESEVFRTTADLDFIQSDLKIYVSRKAIKRSRLLSIIDNRLDISDLFFVMANMEQLLESIYDVLRKYGDTEEVSDNPEAKVLVKFDKPRPGPLDIAAHILRVLSDTEIYKYIGAVQDAPQEITTDTAEEQA